MQDYTLTIYSEDQTGLLSKIVGVIARRHYGIHSLTASPSSMEGIYRFSVCLSLEEVQMRKLALQIEKLVDVLKVFYYNNDEIIYQEIALYKVPKSALKSGNQVEQLIRKHNARIVTIEDEYIVLEKTGHQSETEALLIELKEIGIYEFVRSGKIAVVKPMERLNTYLKSIEAQHNKKVV